jgi:hypothetical protein
MIVFKECASEAIRRWLINYELDGLACFAHRLLKMGSSWICRYSHGLSWEGSSSLLLDLCSFGSFLRMAIFEMFAPALSGMHTF